MLNRIFYISESVFQAGKHLPPGDNVFYSVLVNPLDKTTMENAYRLIDNTHTCPFGLTLDLQEILKEDAIRFIASFLFLPSYLRIGRQPVINIAGKQTMVLDQASNSLQSYLGGQGVNEAIVNKLVFTQITGDYYQITEPGASLQQQYHSILLGQKFYNNPVFIRAESINELESAQTILENEEVEFANNFPKLVATAKSNMAFENALEQANAKLDSLQQELKNQEDYNALLRSDHSTRELQDYYNYEYEILPTWYKRFGHILKVVTGKRTFRSLFRDDVKKYKK